MNIEIILSLSFILFLISFFYFLKNNDEFPLIIFLFFAATGLNRYYSVLNGEVEWIRVNYAYSIFSLDDLLALEALNLFFLGTGVFIFSYIFFNRNKKNKKLVQDNDSLFNVFLTKKSKFIFTLYLVFVFINGFTYSILGNAENLAFGNSYAFLFKLAIGGLILLIYLLYKKISFKSQFIFKSILLLLFLFSAYFSYNPTLRFQFLSWIIALGILSLKDTPAISKLRIYLIGGFLVIIFFSLAGVTRNHDLSTLTLEEGYNLALDRAVTTEDQNMLDGFMMVLQVYPHELDYHYGMEHLEILMRPIPRSWWPAKPVGGYANKLGLNELESGTVGISQSIYGTFYGEAGIIGIIILSILYGYFFVRLFNFCYKFNSDMGFLLKGIVIASTIPLLRGGDLPGIIAFIGMSYWPVFLILFQYNEFISLKKYNTRSSKPVLTPIL